MRQPKNRVLAIHDANELMYRSGESEDRMHYQWCRFDIGQQSHFGYRYMWSRNGKLLPLRGGARIPSAALQKRLMAIADSEGWGDLDEASSGGTTGAIPSNRVT